MCFSQKHNAKINKTFSHFLTCYRKKIQKWRYTVKMSFENVIENQ